MNQKDYKKIAEIIKKDYNVYPYDILISELADYFEKRYGLLGTLPHSECRFNRQ